MIRHWRSQTVAGVTTMEFQFWVRSVVHVVSGFVVCIPPTTHTPVTIMVSCGS
jgi:hypothetical protein